MKAALATAPFVIFSMAFCTLLNPAFAQQLFPPNQSVSLDMIPGTTAIDLQTLDRLHAPILREDLKLLGAQSCAAASCHGGPHPGVAQPWLVRGSEYPLWFENDPHSRSWRTISSDESVAMMRRLKIMRGNEIVDQKGFDNCLACHNTTKRFHEPRSDVERKEGVGCSGCHGPEELWNSTHYQYSFDPLQSTDAGFVANGDLLTRARTCAACHVGDQDRDMNHDIIAAGHPALRYELATFHAWEPKHWRDAEASDRTYYEAQLWLAGQIAAADASLSLIQARAAKAHTISEWPELSAYDCSSCHHSLGLKNARRTPSEESNQAIAPYSAWNTAGLLWVIRYRIEQGEATLEDERLAFALDEVRMLMESGPRPDSMQVIAATGEARRAIAAWVDGVAGQSERSQFRSDRLGRIAASAAGKGRSFDTWESAVQLYLAAVAAKESWPGGPSGALRDTSERLRRGLAYPDLTSSPEFALRQRKSPSATRDEVRLTTLELVGWLGPVVTDNEPLPAENDPSPEQLQQQLKDMLEQLEERWKNQPQPQKAPVIPPAPRQPRQPVGPAQPRVAPPVEPKPNQSLDDLRKQLEAFQGDSSDE
jgi:hypothetical protein